MGDSYRNLRAVAPPPAPAQCVQQAVDDTSLEAAAAKVQQAAAKSVDEALEVARYARRTRKTPVPDVPADLTERFEALKPHTSG